MDEGIGSAGRAQIQVRRHRETGEQPMLLWTSLGVRSLPRESVVLTSSQTDVVEAAVVSSS